MSIPSYCEAVLISLYGKHIYIIYLFLYFAIVLLKYNGGLFPDELTISKDDIYQKTNSLSQSLEHVISKDNYIERCLRFSRTRLKQRQQSDVTTSNTQITLKLKIWRFTNSCY